MQIIISLKRYAVAALVRSGFLSVGSALVVAVICFFLAFATGVVVVIGHVFSPGCFTVGVIWVLEYTAGGGSVGKETCPARPLPMAFLAI